MPVPSVHCVIAIDGPAASGKSSVARALARRLNFVYVNSGAFYRAITWHLLERDIETTDHERIAQLVQSSAIRCDLENNESRIRIGGVDPTPFLREDRVNSAVSPVSAVPQVRHFVDEQMRNFARDHDLVVEGRDIGSVVFPDSPYKFYNDASPEVRARRRAAEGQRDQIAVRDRADSLRASAPLVIAKDAEVIDTSNMTIDEVVNRIIALLKQKGLQVP
jgi:CMP/dCMP kinase